jgi:hypothetical protein
LFAVDMCIMHIFSQYKKIPCQQDLTAQSANALMH